ncbi:hypothetical protein ZEAMMB73_Zm00001d028047 [Zea mays]|uniref:Uncharacterized protein n=1 Tax=Zea mays TaxID=4577 RepID=A0A1D6JRL2_MAIZE|nr:hypothetical protein ZEAMMB73_Zm00001d028047 [Zea mays]
MAELAADFLGTPRPGRRLGSRTKPAVVLPSQICALVVQERSWRPAATVAGAPSLASRSRQPPQSRWRPPPRCQEVDLVSAVSCSSGDNRA